MKSAAIGVRAHSGWAALVAVAGAPGSVRVLDRRRIVIADPHGRGANQPYHFAERLELQAAEKHLASCAAASERLALAAFQDVVQDLNNYEIAGVAILLASGRPLPSLPDILASHALIHTAEGEFFRQAIRQACERLGISVTGIRERELGEASALQKEIANLGKIVGPPWTQDQKMAALAAMMVLTKPMRLS
jgi:hypothetical protein